MSIFYNYFLGQATCLHLLEFRPGIWRAGRCEGKEKIISIKKKKANKKNIGNCYNFYKKETLVQESIIQTNFTFTTVNTVSISFPNNRHLFDSFYPIIMRSFCHFTQSLYSITQWGLTVCRVFQFVRIWTRYNWFSNVLATALYATSWTTLLFFKVKTSLHKLLKIHC